MTDGNDTRTNTVNWRDWVLGRGDFSEENLKKARDEFFAKLGQKLHQKMLEAIDRAFSDHDAVPEAIATNDGGTTKDADGTGNTGESLSESLPDYCWDGDTDGGDEMRIADECRDPDLLAAEVRRLKAVIAAGEPTLTDAEREAISEVVDCLTETGTALANATTTRNTLAALLERLK